jgi:hypothetical protein
MLTKEQLHELFDYRDGELYWKVRPSPRSRKRVGDRAGCDFGDGRRIVGIRNKQYLVHRVIFMMHHGWVADEIDHKIDISNIKDNRIENLRAATHGQNSHNAKLPKNNTSGIKGVSWSNTSKKWYVQVVCSKVHVVKRYFDDIELAELVAIEARNKFHGEFARHN